VDRRLLRAGASDDFLHVFAHQREE
jgi:hypothetical protein